MWKGELDAAMYSRTIALLGTYTRAEASVRSNDLPPHILCYLIMVCAVEELFNASDM